MRERAEAATPGPWWGEGVWWEHWTDPEGRQCHTPFPIVGHGSTGADVIARVASTDEDRHYIASWHPAVALAVADWLDTAGADIWAHGPLCECGTGCDACDDNLWEPHARDALAVARAYLGSDA